MLTKNKSNKVVYKSVSTTDLRNNLADSLKSIEGTKNPLIIKYKGKEVFVVVDIDAYEDLLDINDKELKAEIKKGRNEMRKGKFFTTEDVFGNIK
jgi:prevent-host-death family protein